MADVSEAVGSEREYIAGEIFIAAKEAMLLQTVSMDDARTRADRILARRTEPTTPAPEASVREAILERERLVNVIRVAAECLLRPSRPEGIADFEDSIREALRAPAPQEWRAIGEHDGSWTTVLGWDGTKRRVTSLQAGAWQIDTGEWNPTHFAPLIPPPSEEPQ